MNEYFSGFKDEDFDEEIKSKMAFMCIEFLPSLRHF